MGDIHVWRQKMLEFFATLCLSVKFIYYSPDNVRRYFIIKRDWVADHSPTMKKLHIARLPEFAQSAKNVRDTTYEGNLILFYEVCLSSSPQYWRHIWMTPFRDESGLQSLWRSGVRIALKIAQKLPPPRGILEKDICMICLKDLESI